MLWRLLLAIVLLVVVVGGIVGFNLFRDRMIAGFFAGMEPPPVTVSVTEAEPITWTPGIEAIGTASALRGVDLGVEAGGIVQEILFRANDRVEAGQRLVQIDDRMERADVAAAQSQLDLSREQLSRQESLRERGVTSVSELDVARADATAAEATLVRLTAVMEQKALTAPFAGIIGIPQVDVGQYVQPGTVYATLQDVDTLRVDFSIPEQQIRLIEVDMPLTASTEVDGSTAAGKVVAIEPRIDPNSRLVLVRGEIDVEEGTITPGQFLRVRVELPTEDGVIALPQTVLSSTLFGDSVFVVREGEPEVQAPAEGQGDGAAQAQGNGAAAGDGEAGEQPVLTVEQVFVKAGRRSQGMVEIVEGVKPGDRVVTAGQNRLTGGARVMIDNSVNPLPAVMTD
jgi:membrane fusion protein (multidrug efflux system)